MRTILPLGNGGTTQGGSGIHVGYTSHSTIIPAPHSGGPRASLGAVYGAFSRNVREVSDPVTTGVVAAQGSGSYPGVAGMPLLWARRARGYTPQILKRRPKVPAVPRYVTSIPKVTIPKFRLPKILRG